MSAKEVELQKLVDLALEPHQTSCYSGGGGNGGPVAVAGVRG